MLAYPTDTTWLSTISKAGRTRSHLVTSDTFYSRESSVADTCQTGGKKKSQSTDKYNHTTSDKERPFKEEV